MRANARPVAARKPSGSDTTTALNTSDEAAFPDLATAVKQPPPPEEKASTNIQSNASKSGKWIPPHMRSEEKASTTIQSNASKSGKWIPPHMRGK